MATKSSMRRAFTAFHITFAIIVFLESLVTLVHAINSPAEGHLGSILLWLAGLEAIAALLLLISRTLVIAGWLLVAIFTIAIFLHGPLHQMPLFVYLACVVFIMFHGAAYSFKASARA